MAINDQANEPRGLRTPAPVPWPVALPRARHGGDRGHRAWGEATTARGDRTLLDHPAPEPGQRRPRRQHQPQQPQQQATENRQRRGLLVGEGFAQRPLAGDRPGPDDPNQRVAGQRVHHRGHHPDRQIPPPVTGGQHVHPHRDGNAADIQRPRPDRPPAVQRQRDP
jgi:hypothetical protein